MQDNLDQSLDKLAHHRAVAPEYLAPRILGLLDDDKEPFEQLVDWLQASLWRGAATALLPLVLGFTVGNYNTSDDSALWAASDELIYAETLAEYEYDEI